MNRWRFVLEHQLFSGLLGALLLSAVTIVGIIVTLQNNHDGSNSNVKASQATATPTDQPALSGRTTPTRTPQPTPSPTEAAVAEVAGSFGPTNESLDRSGEIDEWTLEGTKDHFIQIRAERNPSGNVQPYIKLIDPFGNEVTSNSGHDYGQVEYWFESTGQFTISVRDRNGDGTGGYEFKYGIDPFTSLDVASPLSGELRGPGQKDWYAFEGTVGQTVEVRVDRDPTGNVEPYARLYNPFGDEQTSNSGHDYAQFDKMLADTGRFLIAVVDRNGSGRGRYTVTLSVR